MASEETANVRAHQCMREGDRVSEGERGGARQGQCSFLGKCV